MSSETDIIFFANSLQGGGAEKMIVELANGLHKRGYQTEIVLIKKEGPNLKKVNSDVPVVDLESEPYIDAILPFIRYITRNPPEYIFSTLTTDNLLSILASKFSLVPTESVICVTNNPSKADYEGIRGKIVTLSSKYLYRFSDKRLAVSKTSAKDASRFFGIPFPYYIYVPIDINEIIKKSQETIDEPWLTSEFQEPVFLGVGRLDPFKDFQTLIKAFNKYNEERPARLIILGEGELQNELVNLAQQLDIYDRIKFLGYVDNPYPYMKSADALVQSSIHEAGSYVMIESMACGTPVVSTKSGGGEEILNSGEYGPVVPTKNPKALCEAMNSIINNPISEDKLISRAQDFSIERVLSQYEEFLLN